MKYEYKFEAVDIRKAPQAYQDRTRELAADGWRLVQVLVELPAAVPSEFVLILEREADPA